MQIKQFSNSHQMIRKKIIRNIISTPSWLIIPCKAEVPGAKIKIHFSFPLGLPRHHGDRHRSEYWQKLLWTTSHLLQIQQPVNERWELLVLKMHISPLFFSMITRVSEPMVKWEEKDNLFHTSFHYIFQMHCLVFSHLSRSGSQTSLTPAISSSSYGRTP